MSATKPVAATVLKWLRNNGHSLAPVTHQDSRALLASVQLVPLWSPYDDDGGAEIAKAWGVCVRQMQEQTRQLAFHAVAHVLNWNDRFALWEQAGFEALPNPCYKCKYER